MNARLTTEALERHLLHSCLAAGRSAKSAGAILPRLLPPGTRPFAFIRSQLPGAALGRALRTARIGHGTRLERCLRGLVQADLDLRTCTPGQLEAIPGIGPRTSRFFLLLTRPGARYAALDAHILRWLRQHGHDAPHHTPTGARYRRLEDLFIAEASRRGLTPGELDAQIRATPAVDLPHELT